VPWVATAVVPPSTAPSASLRSPIWPEMSAPMTAANAGLIEHVGALEHIRHVLEPSDAAGKTGHEDGRVDR
jgi:hypothetical protein